MDNEFLYFKQYIDKCLRCDGINYKDIDADKEDPYTARCLLCDRYFEKGKIFLNNVG
ncbi:MAG: hypothetical protein GY754_20550 [bacterium]|nr:hypothetical protein [bacterium]